MFVARSHVMLWVVMLGGVSLQNLEDLGLHRGDVSELLRHLMEECVDLGLKCLHLPHVGWKWLVASHFPIRMCLPARWYQFLN